METDGSTEILNFEKLANDSAASLKADAEIQIKNKGGRPPGSKNKKGRENDAPAQKIAGPGGQVPPGSVPLSNGVIMPEIDLEPLTRDAVKMPFAFWAFKAREPGLELTDDEGKTATYYLNRCINLYMPELQEKDPKTLNFWALVVSLLSLFVKKSVKSLATKQARMAQAAQVNPETQAPPAQAPNSGPVTPKPTFQETDPTISASDYLGRRG